MVFFQKFSERISFLIPRIESVREASTQVLASPAFKGLLELVLALGKQNCRRKLNGPCSDA